MTQRAGDYCKIKASRKNGVAVVRYELVGAGGRK